MTPEKTIFCPGHFNLPGSSHLFRDWKPKGHGTIEMRHAIQQSCDVYFYTVAERLGIDRMHDFMSQFATHLSRELVDEVAEIQDSTARTQRVHDLIAKLHLV